MADPWPLFRSAIPRIAALVGAENVVAEYWQRRRRGFIFRKFEETKLKELAWENLVTAGDMALREERFPDRFRFLNQEQVVLCAVSEPWGMVGGPRPYHDSLTVSFFTATPLQEALRSIFTEEACKLGVSIQDTTRAEPLR